MNREQKKNNLRLALVLASVALVFFVGFVGKMVLFGG
ncbi:cytochrome oxidase small assembly protein [Hydrogenophaga crassostreae]|nr:cytochrome oxidase small assembly protein [Hydrogenophaga crassostreae]